MPAYKDTKTKKWFASFYYVTYQGERKKKCKRGFKNKEEAKQFEREFLAKISSSSSMSFKSLYELYLEDLSCRLRETTIQHKKNIIETKILPYFQKLSLDDITPVIIRNWQNKMMKFRAENGNPYSQTYLRSIHSQLSAVFNYAVKYHNLKENPCHKAGSIGKKHADEMEIWTVDEFNTFIKLVEDHPITYTGYQVLFWTGMRIGELLGLSLGDIDFENKIIKVTKSYQRLKGRDIISQPKTSKSKRNIDINQYLVDILKKYVNMLYKPDKNTRLFNCTKSIFEHELKKYSLKANLKPIRVHDLRHSHASFLFNKGINILAISKRLGHENIETTLKTYSHLYESSNELILQVIDNACDTNLILKK